MANKLINKHISKTISLRQNFLENLMKEPNIRKISNGNHPLRFLIGRQWNSWYPSYFSSIGGCYAIETRDKEKITQKNAGVIVIDPGFGFLTSLRKYFHIEPQNIRQIFVSHFHPDHMAGLIEFATLSYESDFPCNVFLNETSYEFFKPFHGKNLKIFELKPGQIRKIFDYPVRSKTKEARESAFVKVIPTHHSEIGLKHGSLGLIFEFSHKRPSGNHQKSIEYTQKIAIMGDTDGNEKYMPEYAKNFADVDSLILHLGSYDDEKYGIGDAHLYYKGVNALLKELKSKDYPKKPELILLSEFGLELGSMSEIVDFFNPFFESYNYCLLLSGKKKISNVDSNKFEKEIYANLMYEQMIRIDEKCRTGLKKEELEEIICIFAILAIIPIKKLEIKIETIRKYSHIDLNDKTPINILKMNLNFPKLKEFENDVKDYLRRSL